MCVCERVNSHEGDMQDYQRKANFLHVYSTVLFSLFVGSSSLGRCGGRERERGGLKGLRVKGEKVPKKRE